MKPINDGGSAFPEIFTDNRNGPPDTYSAGGMTLRDYFAASVVHGIRPWDINPKEFSEWAYKMADEMLLAREKK